MPNRVADLESTVAQLQATVDGLREELVDANERIRALERELESETAVEEAAARPHERSNTDTTEESGGTSGSIEDIIVA